MLIRTRTIGTALLAVAATSASSLAAAFDPLQATDVYLSAIDAGARQRAAAYTDGVNALNVARAVFVVLMALVIFRGGLSLGFRNLASSRGAQTAITATLTLLLIALLMSPLEHYRGFVLEHEFDRSTQTFELWLRDYLISSAIVVVAAVIGIVAVYALMRRFPRTWWLWSGALSTLAAAAFVVAAPFMASALFNTYEPMERGPLKAHVLTLAQGRGLAVGEVYRFDASRQNKRLTAEVTPWIGPVRVALGDNLLDRGSGSEVRAVVGHHIGRRSLGHALERLATFAVIALIALFIVASVLRWIVRAEGAALGLSDEADAASIPLLVALTVLAGLAATPAFNAVLRAQEGAAENFSLNAAREPDALATIALKRAEFAKLDPAPWEQAIFASRPTARETILRAMQWKAGQLDTVPVPDFEVEVGCSLDHLHSPSADVRWVADGTPLENLRIDVAVTEQGFAAGRYAGIFLATGAARFVPNTDFSPTSLDLAVDPPVAQRPAFERTGPLLVAVRVNNLAPGVLYFWRVVRAEGGVTTTLRTETSSCPADVEEEE